ncbi:WhiB family transcriptional regulator [Streptomyces sp. Da 82-17]|uniref:WhiB family transcriptional regulator n=1 Tax=Streptomyces sp. Da 82-17 TaxID=3377116 RepID=UPI0038D4DA08
MTTRSTNGTSRPITSAAALRAEPLVKTWRDRAECRSRPLSWWDGDRPYTDERARTVCRSCPVLAECLGERMRDEGTNTWSRWGVAGGLRGPERTELMLDEREHGAYDAEEARLLALEAVAERRPVAEVAPGAVSVSTVRLAARLAGELVETRKPSPAPVRPGGRVVARAFARSEEILRLRGAGLTLQEIANQVGIGRHSVGKVVRAHEAMVTEAGVELGVAA